MIRATNPKQWIEEHNPDQRGREFLLRALVASSSSGSAASGPFDVVRSKELIWVAGEHSTLLIKDREELDQLVAAILKRGPSKEGSSS